jgi:electron transfer flavoprotein alpha subunit
MILIVTEHRDGAWVPITKDLVGMGLKMGAELGMPVSALAMGQGVGELASQLAGWQLDRVFIAEDATLARPNPEAQGRVLDAAIEEARATFVLSGHTAEGLEFVPRVAVRRAAAFVPGCVGYEMEGDTLLFARGVFNGKLHMRVSLPHSMEGTPSFLSVAPGSWSGPDLEAGPGVAPEPLTVDLSDLQPRMRLVGIEAAAGGEVSLGDADTIVSVGRGIGKEDNLPVVQALADALDAPLGASRPVVDAGWLPRDRQIGSSGQTVAPRLYVAVGISGAVQHLVGMQSSQCIVAINKDAEAPVFKVAHYGIAGDLFEIVPELTRLIRELKGKSG